MQMKTPQNKNLLHKLKNVKSNNKKNFYKKGASTTVPFVYNNLDKKPLNHIMPCDFHPDFPVQGTGMTPKEWEEFANKEYKPFTKERVEVLSKSK